ncbi:prepilin-type N-terminal cleavage/methylation domain-containing protein [Dactylosporangium sp. NPDC049742]|uniref:PulJ/GspJ family protein n=1 Tax=Dactylosporangium sp. NPDC049742 TaxID=3154737 RepID=UPI0034205082
MRLTDRRDAGFTLIELLVAVAILGVIAVPLANVVIAYVRQSTATTQRVSLSRDAQIAAAWFADDVATIGTRDEHGALKQSIVVGGTFSCGMTPVSPVVRFLADRWDSATAVGTVVIAYELRGDELHRIRCAGTTAVNQLRNSTFRGTGTDCFGTTGTKVISGLPGGRSAGVDCTAAATGGAAYRCESAANCNRPGSAVLTLGRVSGEPGFTVQQPNNAEFKVHGTVFSNSTGNIASGKLDADGSPLYARGACTGTIVNTPTKACGLGGAANPLGDDPGYAPATSAAPARRTLPACTTPSSIVTFQPGTYDDAAGLSAMMAGNSACKNSIWWFRPGTYYFDFRNSGTDRNPLLSNAANVWTIDDGSLVAGTPVALDGTVIAAPRAKVEMPGMCANPITDGAAVGVQFIFGGDSRLAVKAGQVEICGSYSSNRPPVAVYGLNSGTAVTTTLTGATALRPGTVTAAGGFGATATPANLRETGDNLAASWKAGKTNDSTTLTVSGFAPATPVPAGSVLKGANLRITHRHTNTGNTDSFTASLTPSGATGAVIGTVTGRTGSATYQTSVIPLDTAATGELAKAVTAGTFTGATLALASSLRTNNDTQDIDAIQLELSYQAPAFRAGTGCVTATPYTGSGGPCAMLSTVNSSGNLFYAQGTTGLRVKLAIADPGPSPVAGARQVTVLSWSRTQ